MYYIHILATAVKIFLKKRLKKVKIRARLGKYCILCI